MTKTKKFILTEQELPTQWYNIQADMKHKLLHPLNLKTYFKSESAGPLGLCIIHSAFLPCWHGKRERVEIGYSVSFPVKVV